MASISGTPAEQLRALNADDFSYDNPEADGWQALVDICDDLRSRGVVIELADEMFALMERLDDTDLGSPGPLVHALESTGTAYEPGLRASVRRKPSPLSLWMVNRILNTDPPDRDAWMDLLATATSHPLASGATRAEAEGFLAYQRGEDLA